ncbi:hypothetical protein FOS39_09290 [Lactobacillus paracasei]|nr:hypothetical protein [Lacticaseibacillus paracasei]
MLGKCSEKAWYGGVLCSFTKRARGSQQPPCKDLPKPSQLGSRPLTLRLLNAPAPALLHSKK